MSLNDLRKRLLKPDLVDFYKGIAVTGGVLFLMWYLVAVLGVTWGFIGDLPER